MAVIKVNDNGVPLAAIASIEFNAGQATLRRCQQEALAASRTYCNRYVVNFPGHSMRMPLLRLPCTEAEARRLRDEWIKQYPEVAAYLSYK